jgi:hypothetical protein
MAAARPLPVECRDAFLQAVAAELDGRELGPGLVHRVVSEVQRRFWMPPALAAGAPGRGAKYR